MLFHVKNINTLSIRRHGIFFLLISLWSCQSIEPTITPVNQSQIALRHTSTFSNPDHTLESVHFSNTGLMAVTSTLGLLILDPGDGQIKSKITGGFAPEGVRLADNGTALVVYPDHVKLISVVNGELLKQWNMQTKLAQTALSSNGQYVIVGDQLWDVTANRLLGRFPLSNMFQVYFSPDNRFIVYIGLDSIFISERANLNTYKEIRFGGSVSRVLFLSDNYEAVVAHSSKKALFSIGAPSDRISVVSLEKQVVIAESKDSDTITHLEVSKKSGDILTSSESGLVNLHDKDNILPTRSWQLSSPLSELYSDHNGRIWMGNENGDILIYDPLTKNVSQVAKLSGNIMNITTSETDAYLAIIRFNVENKFKYRIDVYKIM